jgi:nickel-dependent lactate racemase
MALTKAFFRNLALEFREARPQTGPDSTPVAVWAHCITITANSLARNHSGFNYGKFYEACGMPQEAIDRVAQL